MDCAGEAVIVAACGSAQAATASKTAVHIHLIRI
jgi:hypothetical protein